MNLRVAAITADSTVVERKKQDTALWQKLVDELIEKSVRVLVYKDSSEVFRNTLHRSMQNTQISNVCGPGPSFFVLGPVGKATTKTSKKIFTFNATVEDKTQRWPTLEEAKLKELKLREAGTNNTLVYIGSTAARRTPEQLARRHESEAKRVKNRGMRPWVQRWW